MHCLIPFSSIHVHSFIQHLNSLPILLAGLLFGWRGAVVPTLLSALLQFPHLWRTWNLLPVYVADMVLELPVFGLGGVLAGLSAERLYAAGQLSAGRAQEIRNPLASVSGAAGILRRGHATLENARECLDIIDKETQRINRLLSTFLDIARPRAPRFQAVELPTLFGSVIALAQHVPGASLIDLRQELAGPPPRTAILSCSNCRTTGSAWRRLSANCCCVRWRSSTGTSPRPPATWTSPAAR